MKKHTLLIMAILGLIPQLAFSDKMIPVQHDNSINFKKIHPMERYLSSIKKDSQKDTRIDSENNRLLILLIGFEEETTDDPQSTGNGQFQMDVPADYLPQISRPPHDLQYYNEISKAMKYYYTASSLGTFDLEWDIYPKTKSCYTLPNPMSYYHPVGASNEVFVASMEEYFKSSLELADVEDPEIVFSDYDHYMIIHAGSDWQHDVLSDTPVDIPSFFIRVGDGKEAVVDDGFIIDHACNIPETITQDVQEYMSGDLAVVTGYGALNGVMFHEFGHSMGLVDLYAVNSNQPMVGSFDIMDSGGSTEANIYDYDLDKLISVEGIIPALPGAFSKELMFEQQFRANNILKDLENLEDLDEIMIDCAETKHGPLSNPCIYKYRLNDDEYLLIENRSVDPDGDGGTAIHGSLDQRVSLYPTTYADNGTPPSPSFEYDYLLPSFITEQNHAIGGGILVWKVNEKVIYAEGDYDSQGDFVSNFNNNYVNTSFDSRGVEIIEADDIPDIGNVYARWWRGTAFEYFFKNRPTFVEGSGNDFFEEWSTDIHADALNGSSDPALLTASGEPVSLGLHNISAVGSTMSFSFGSSLYPYTSNINVEEDILGVSGFIDGFTKQPEILIMKRNSMDVYYKTQEEGPFEYSNPVDVNFSYIKYDIITVDFNDDGNDEVVIFDENDVVIYCANGIYRFPIDSQIANQPILRDKSIMIPSKEKTIELSFDVDRFTFSTVEWPFEAEHIVSTMNETYLIRDDKAFNIIYTEDEAGLEIITTNEYNLPGSVINTKPVMLNNKSESENGVSLILLTNDNMLYSLNNGSFELLYDLSNVETHSTNLALTYDNYGPIVLFGNANTLYAFYTDGTLVDNFPRNFYNYSFTSTRDIKVIDNSYMENGSYSTTYYLPIDDSNWVAYDVEKNKLDSRLSISNSAVSKSFSQSVIGNHIYQINRFDTNVSISWTNDEAARNTIIWDPEFANNSRCLEIDNSFFTQVDVQSLEAYVFPNPVRSDKMTLRVKGLSTEQCKVTIYNIAGKIVKEELISNNDLSHVDKVIPIENLSSGVYFGIIKASKTVKFKFAVIK